MSGPATGRGFVVSWSIDVHADNAHHAAQIAIAVMADPAAHAPCVDVCADDDGHTIAVDLAEPADALRYPVHHDRLRRRCVWSQVPHTDSLRPEPGHCPKGCPTAVGAGRQA